MTVELAVGQRFRRRLLDKYDVTVEIVRLTTKDVVMKLHGDGVDYPGTLRVMPIQAFVLWIQNT